MHIISGIAQCITIIGIPVGIANFKIAAIALWPVGRRVAAEKRITKKKKKKIWYVSPLSL